MMQGLQSFVRLHGYLLYNIDIDQDNPFYEPMETFSFVYFPNEQVLFSVYEHSSNSCLDNHILTLKNQYSLCHQNLLHRNSVFRKSALEEGYFGLNFELCVCQIFFLHFSDRRSLIFWWWWCDKHYIICNRDYWQETYIKKYRFFG